MICFLYYFVQNFISRMLNIGMFYASLTFESHLLVAIKMQSLKFFAQKKGPSTFIFNIGLVLG